MPATIPTPPGARRAPPIVHDTLWARFPALSPWEPGRLPGRAPYLSLRVRFALSLVAGLAWVAFSVWIALPWIADLADALPLPLALLIVAGIAVLPGYLNAQLVCAILLDRPPGLRLDVALPPVAALIAARNEEASIGETLTAALRSNYPGPLEVVVVDDGSTDRTAEIVREVAARDDRVRLIRVAHGGKAHALNTGLITIDAPVVATIDADTFLLPDTLKRAVARLTQSPPDTVAVAGGVLVRNSRANLLTRAQEWDYFLGIASVKREQSLLRGTLVAQGAFSVYRTAALRRVGGWPDMIGEDIVLTWAMLDAGGRTGYEATAVAFTDVPRETTAFLRQRERWARGMIEGLRTYGSRLVRRGRLYSHAVAVDWTFPFLDLAVTLALIPGIVLAAFGNFAIVGLMTIAVLPLNAVVAIVLFTRQRRVFQEVGLSIRRNRAGLLCYLLLYQFIMSPISVIGYLKETLRVPREW
jgi:biofilm PGA synthesis N-glycosyltransferase PgaC